MSIKCRKVMGKRLIQIILLVLILITVYHPERHAKYYPFIPKAETLTDLVENRDDLLSNLKPCVYNLLLDSKDVSVRDIYKEYTFKNVHRGGEYIPSQCRPLYKSAVIVPYRNRESQLYIFLNYIHSFLQKQNIHYRIYIVDQRDTAPFNRGKNLNIGAREAILAGFPCLILHDVDLMPLNNANIYACTRYPRHMSSCVDTFRFNMPYVELFGGAVAINTNQFIKINGFSNVYDGWGAEDDDFYRRLKAHNISTCRFSPEISRYTMLKHKKEVPSANRHKLLSQALKRQGVDGLNSLAHQYTVIEKPLYTHIIAK